MSDSLLPYEFWIEDALRGVVRRALQYTSQHSLPGDHHFYVTFATGADGVAIPPPLRARYPNEMTIVLQHQFWDLEVTDDAFSVTLKFHGQPNRLHIPFTAITAFGDPSVNFGLQLRINRDDGEAETTARALPATRTNAAGDESPEPASGEVIALDTFRKK